MNKNYLIIGAALVGGGLYFAFKKGLLDKFIKKTTPEEAIDESKSTIKDIEQEQKAATTETKKVAITQAVVSGAKLLYKRRVEQLQVLLKVGVDGNPGRANSQTNKALAKTYGLDKGQVNPMNVLYYIRKVTNNYTLLAQAQGKNKVTISKNKVVRDAQKFVDLVNNKGLTARLLEDTNANKFQFDKVKSIFIDMKTPKTFSKGTSFSKGAFTSQTRGAFVLIKDGAFVYAIDPSKFIVN